MSGSIQHHPKRDELVEYASGALSTAQALCVSSHLDFCGPCRRMVGRVERLGGALLEDLNGVAVEERALEQVWQRIQNAPPQIGPDVATDRKDPVPRGMEWTVVLQGSFSDHAGLYLPGDYLRCEPGHVHLPVATRDRECICLTVHDGAVRFTGWWQRWVNPLLRIAT